MADVYKGRDARLARDVAIKVLKSTLSTDASARERFRREAMAVSKMAHPTVVRVFDAGDEGDTDDVGNPTGSTTPYIVMEFVQGRLLGDIIHRGIIDEAAALGIADGMLNALEVSHQAGIVHRDIKPANVMITTNGGVKVMDFGIARAIADTVANGGETSSILGTAMYLSPEQARGQDATERSDLYALGVVLYEMLAGRPPFEGDSPVAVAFQHINDEPAPLGLQNPSVSKGTAAIVHKLLEKEPAHRFSSATEVRKALLALPEPGTQEAEQTQWAPAASDTEPPVVTSSIPQATWQSRAEPAVDFTLPAGQNVQQASVPRLAIALGSVIAISMLIAIVVWLFTLNPTTVSTATAPMVPDLRGQSQVVAVSTIESLGLTPSVIEEVSGEFEEGLVIRTEPGTGIRVAPGERVRVYVSAGADQIRLPDLVNQTSEDARARVTELGLGLTEDRTDYSPNIPEGTVLATLPEAGVMLNPSDPITLVVSNGLVQVPDVRGITVGEANPLLSGPDIQLTVRLQPDPTCLGQTVQAQSLTPGEHPQRSEITLTYCAGFDPANPFVPEEGDG
jgi:serine/threonine-protein kinase